MEDSKLCQTHFEKFVIDNDDNRGGVIVSHHSRRRSVKKCLTTDEALGRTGE